MCVFFCDHCRDFYLVVEMKTFATATNNYQTLTPLPSLVVLRSWCATSYFTCTFFKPKGSGIHAPGRHEHPTTEPYLVAHHLLLAHAKVYHLYHEHFTDDTGTGVIGMANCGDFRYPRHHNNHEDAAAAERAMLFQWGWFVDPLVYGDYPTVMRQRLGERLPVFTAAERDTVRGSFDFLGLNYYSSLLASTPPPAESTGGSGGYWDDMHVAFRYVH